MKGFKLIAITALNRCSTDFCKNLEIGKPYQFYNNYDITIDDSCESIIKVVPNKPTVPPDLYKLKNGINLNISAVVGKNGSGKSTLFELLFYLVSIIATEKENLPNRISPHSQTYLNKSKELLSDYLELEKILGHDKNKKSEELKINNLELEKTGYKTITAYLIMLIKKHDLKIDIKLYNTDIDSALKIWSEIGYQKAVNDYIANEEKPKEDNIKKNLNLSVIYQIDETIYGIEYINSKFSHHSYHPEKLPYKDSINEFSITDFFYSIAINYSHHSVNSKNSGNWIIPLFHKNDAYITPLVINPMRDEGNFDINHELSLSKERLMSNIIFKLVNNKEFKLLDKYKISKFIFTPKTLISYPINYGIKLEKDSTLNTLLIDELGIDVINENIYYWDFALAYLDRKIKRISENYSFLIYSNKNSEDPLLDFIKQDKTHITKKIRQTFKFLKSTLNPENREFWKTPADTVRISLPAATYLQWLNKFDLEYKSLKPSDIIEYAHPGFFSIDFELESESGETVLFGKLSSGEQQMIQNSNAILYHLNNLQSVHLNKEDPNDRIKYNNINIILDEVELYYHPEMQRQLVENIKESFETIKNVGEEGISSINVCFLTHSPFILSDIPIENILKLTLKEDEYNGAITETFGANIYDILGDAFFMNKGFIGEFAMDKIKEILDYIDKKTYIPEKQNHYLQITNLIADDAIRLKLEQLLSSLYEDPNNELEKLKSQQKEIEAQIKKLETK